MFMGSPIDSGVALVFLTSMFTLVCCSLRMEIDRPWKGWSRRS